MPREFADFAPALLALAHAKIIASCLLVRKARVPSARLGGRD
jgi:hypothetical protein